jgi:hypothetical protein
VLRFVGICDRPAVWRVSRDGLNLPPSGIWLFARTDSLDFAPTPGVHSVEWTELEADGSTVGTVQATETDSSGTARVMATCLP